MAKKYYTLDEIVFAEHPKSKKFKDLTGKTLNRLTVLGLYEQKDKKSYWFCKCECGSLCVIQGHKFTSETTKSCGCLQREWTAKMALLEPTREACIKRLTKHGKRHSRVYTIYGQMRSRCYNSKSISYQGYGARGITVCDRWLESFENFYADMGDPPEGFSIDRIDNDKGYSPDNCRWADAKTQANNRRSSRILTYNGTSLTVAQWGLRLNTNPDRLHNRLSDKWCVPCTLTIPLNGGTCTHKPTTHHPQSSSGHAVVP
jgi:hypothetical protein